MKLWSNSIISEIYNLLWSSVEVDLHVKIDTKYNYVTFMYHSVED